MLGLDDINRRCTVTGGKPLKLGNCPATRSLIDDYNEYFGETFIDLKVNCFNSILKGAIYSRLGIFNVTMPVMCYEDYIFRKMYEAVI